MLLLLVRRATACQKSINSCAMIYCSKLIRGCFSCPACVRTVLSALSALEYLLSVAFARDGRFRDKLYSKICQTHISAHIHPHTHVLLLASCFGSVDTEEEPAARNNRESLLIQVGATTRLLGCPVPLVSEALQSSLRWDYA